MLLAGSEFLNGIEHLSLSPILFQLLLLGVVLWSCQAVCRWLIARVRQWLVTKHGG